MPASRLWGGLVALSGRVKDSLAGEPIHQRGRYLLFWLMLLPERSLVSLEGEMGWRPKLLTPAVSSIPSARREP